MGAVISFFRSGYFSPRGYWNLGPTGQFDQLERVLHALVDQYVPGDHGYRLDAQFRGLGRQQDGHGVVNARVGIENDPARMGASWVGACLGW